MGVNGNNSGCACPGAFDARDFGLFAHLSVIKPNDPFMRAWQMRSIALASR
jgi:hypothetical protein